MQNIAQTLWKTASDYPHARATEGNAPSMTYAQLLQHVQKGVHALARAGVSQGDRVAIYADNSANYLAAIYAIYAMGSITVPINSKLVEKEIGYICANAQVKLVLTTQNKKEKIPNSVLEKTLLIDDLFASDTATPMDLQPVAQDQIATLFYTSGTTGNPKGVMLTHSNLWAMTNNYLQENQNTSNAVMVYAAPISHGAGMYAYGHVALAGIHYFCQAGSFDPSEIVKAGKSIGKTVFFAAPTMLNRVVQFVHDADIKDHGIQNIIVGGAPLLPVDLKKAVQVLGPIISQIYGQGECPMVISHVQSDELCNINSSDWHIIAKSCGRPYKTTEVRMQKKNINDRIGEIIVKSPAVMRGYWQNEKATQETIKDGWLHTGDIGFVDAKGYVHISDRLKEMIITGGSNVYCVEVERVLLEHPNIKEVAVFGVPDENWGERVIAAVTLNKCEDFKFTDLRAFALENLAAYKRPKEYMLCEYLPKSGYGKILKQHLKEIYKNGAYPIS